MAINRLRATQLTLTKGKPVQLNDGLGLYFQRLDSGSAFWSYRYKSPVTGKSRSYGIGPAHLVTLHEARDAAQECRKQVRAGIDPLDARKAAEEARAAALAKIERTFKTVAGEYIESHKAGWSNEKHAAQWTATLEAYAYPTLGKLPVSAIATGDVLACLKPIWETKPETASRVRQRIEAILDYAKAQSWRSGDNPAALKGNLNYLLPSRAKVARVEHHAALPWQDVPAFMGELAAAKGIAALALRFLILTAARTGEVIGATWGEIDMTAKTWTIPAERMKARTEHRVPLSDGAMAILEAVKPFKRGDDKPVFPSPSVGSLSNMTLAAVMKRLKRDETVHGFRSSFRDWTAETTTWPREICEAALAHTVGGVEGAYRRGDLFDKRRQLMTEWAVYCGEEL